MSTKNANFFVGAFKGDYILVTLVLVLWTFGRLLRIFLQSFGVSVMSGNISGLTSGALLLLYMCMHGVVFLYASWLFVIALRNRFKNKIKLVGWQFILYIYVLIAVFISFCFLLYEFFG